VNVPSESTKRGEKMGRSGVVVGKSVMRSLKLFNSMFCWAYWIESWSISGVLKCVSEGICRRTQEISDGPVAMNVHSGFIREDNSGYIADAPVPLRERGKVSNN
jgi:hypothetical protein